MRIRGELLKLGYVVSATSIRNLIQKHGLPTSPRRSRLSWREFLRAQASAIVVTDYFTVDTWNLKRLYVLFFMELATRRILCFGVTEHPNQEWVSEQARTLTWELQERGSQAKFLICDHDKKFPFAFDHVLAGDGVRVIRTPLNAPKANAHAERWVGSARRECFDWLIIRGRPHLDLVLTSMSTTTTMHVRTAAFGSSLQMASSARSARARSDVARGSAESFASIHACPVWLPHEYLHPTGSTPGLEPD